MERKKIEQKVRQFLDNKTWEFASKLKTHSFKSYTKEEVINSINFLEMLILRTKMFGSNEIESLEGVVKRRKQLGVTDKLEKEAAEELLN